MKDIHPNLWKRLVTSNMDILAMSHKTGNKNCYASELFTATETLKIIMVEYATKLKCVGPKDKSFSPEEALHALAVNHMYYMPIKATYEFYDFYIEGDIECGGKDIEVPESVVLLASDEIDYAVQLYNNVANCPAQWSTSVKMKDRINPKEVTV